MKNTVKRIFCLIMVLTMVFSMAVPAYADGEDICTCGTATEEHSAECAITLAAQPEPQTVPHQHAYDAGVVTTQPTCITAGVMTFTCANAEGCDALTYTEAIPATGVHTYVDGVCSVEGCGALEPKQHEHAYDAGVVTTQPSCFAEGVMTYTCANAEGCDKLSYTEAIPATGAHTYVDGVCSVEGCGALEPKAPTCDKTLTCPVSEGHEADCLKAIAEAEAAAAEAKKQADIDAVQAKIDALHIGSTPEEIAAVETAIGTLLATYGIADPNEVLKMDNYYSPKTLDEVTNPVAMIGETKFATLQEAVNAAENGDTIVLQDNVTLADAETFGLPADVSLDLSFKTLTLNGESGTLAGNNIIKNGDIVITTFTGDTIADGIFDTNGNCIVENVNISSSGCAIYSVFDIKTGTLTINGGSIKISNNKVGDGGVIFFNGGEKLIMNGVTVNCTNPGDFITNGIAELNNCNIVIKGTVDKGLDNAINGTALTLNNTNLTVDGATGRGLTSDGDTLAIKGTSVVSLTNCAEAGIRFKENGQITVESTATLNETTIFTDSKVTSAKVNDTVIDNREDNKKIVSVLNGNVDYSVEKNFIDSNNTYFADLQSALNGGSGTIKVLKDITLSAPVSNTNTITLDLSGKTISYESNKLGEAMITNSGSLTISDSEDTGRISYKYTGAADSTYSAGNYTIANTGTLSITGGTVENTTAAMKHASYAIDNYSSGQLSISGGLVLNNTNYAVRMFSGSASGTNSVTVSGGEVKGTRAVWIQLAGSDSSVAPSMNLTVNGGTLTGTGESANFKLAVYSYNYGNSTSNTKVTVSSGTVNGDIALCGGTNKTVSETLSVTGGTLTDLYSYADVETAKAKIEIGPGAKFTSGEGAKAYLPEGYTLSDNGDGTLSCVEAKVAQIGSTTYGTLKAAFAAAMDGDTITLLDDVILSKGIECTEDVTLDLNSKKITTDSNCDNPAIRITNSATLKVVDNAGGGSMDSSASGYCFILGASGNVTGNLTIESGSFHGATSVASVTNGTLEINDGSFSVEPYNGSYDYLLNCIDANYNAGTANIIVSGGSFIGFDPKNNAAEGAKTDFLNKSKCTIQNADGSFSVVTPVTSIISGNTVKASYLSFDEAYAAAAAGDTIKLYQDINSASTIVIDKAITIDGNGNTFTYTGTNYDSRAININTTGNVIIKNLEIDASGIERAINVIQKPVNLTVENVTATASNYTVNVASSAGAAKLTIDNSTLNGLNAVNVAGAGADVTITNSTINCNDNDPTAGESFAALCLNKDATNGKIIATNCIVNVAEGSDSEKGRNSASGGVVTINGSTDDVSITTAVITYPDSDYYHGFATLAEALSFAKDSDTITLIRDIVLSEEITVSGNKTIAANGHTFDVDTTKGSIKLNSGAQLTITGHADEDAKIEALRTKLPGLCITKGSIVIKEHTYSYSAKDNVITETCVNEDKDGKLCPHKAYATIGLANPKKPSTPYTGAAITDMLALSYVAADASKGINSWAGAAPTLSFKNNINPGDATGTISIGTATASATFKIVPAELSGEPVGKFYRDSGSSYTFLIKTSELKSVEGLKLVSPLSIYTSSGKHVIDSTYFNATWKDGDLLVTVPDYIMAKLGTGRYELSVTFANATSDYVAYSDCQFRVRYPVITPSTGDPANFLLWGGLLLGAMAAMGGTLVILKKKGKNQ